jgi:uncharacterized membrane protein
VSLYDWLLFLHVLAAFSLVAGVVLQTYMLVSGRRSDRPAEVVTRSRVVRVGDVLWAIGAGGTLVFGIWLALEVDGYQIWDAWIVAALVLWVVVGAIGERVARHYNDARDLAKRLVSEGRDEPSSELGAILRSPRGLILHGLALAGMLLILLDMIWKPGA